MVGTRRRPTGYWAFLASPRTYDIDRAVRELKEDWWTTKGKPIRRGDRALIWKAKGIDGRRGIVAFGRIVNGPESRADSENTFWLDPSSAETLEERVLVKYADAPHLPLWLHEDEDGVLASLSVAKATGGTVFYVTEEQWQAVVAKARGQPA